MINFDRVFSLIFTAWLIISSSRILSAYISASDYFDIKRVVISDARYIDSEKVKTLCGIGRKQNIFSLDIVHLAQIIQKGHPEIKDIQVERQLPDGLWIGIENRYPVAIISAWDTYLIDEEAVVLPKFMQEKIDLSAFATIVGLPRRNFKPGDKIDSVKLTKALEILRNFYALPDARGYQISLIDVTNLKDVKFFLQGKCEIKIGDLDIEQKIATLGLLLPGLKNSRQLPRYIDLRFRNPVLSNSPSP